MKATVSYICDPKQQQLQLQGSLTAADLNQLWQHNRVIDFTQLTSIDVANLQRVDSAGLALLVYYCSQFNLTLINCSEQLQTLITLYNLKPIVQP